jgi:hypothetical protein
MHCIQYHHCKTSDLSDSYFVIKSSMYWAPICTKATDTFETWLWLLSSVYANSWLFAMFLKKLFKRKETSDFKNSIYMQSTYNANCSALQLMVNRF